MDANPYRAPQTEHVAQRRVNRWPSIYRPWPSFFVVWLMIIGLLIAVLVPLLFG
jgi:hypothetical protein